MPKYKMKNGLKKQPFDGFRDKVLDNGIKVREYVSFVFEPNKVVDTGDFDLINWVRARYLIEIKDESDNKEEHGEKTEDFDSEKLDDEEFGELNKELVIDNKENNIDEDEEDEDEDDGDDGEEDEGEDEEESDIKKNDIKYETIGDGFRCIICGKILKSEKRMSTHIRKKH
jgi:hypothetical protein